MHLFWLAMTINFIFFFPPKNIILPIVLSCLFVINWLIFKNLNKSYEKIFIPTIITAVSLNLLMATNFYPNLLNYQARSQAGKFISEKQIPLDRFYYYNMSSFSLDFYARRIANTASINDIKNNLRKGSWIYTNEMGYNELIENNVSFKFVNIFPSFHVTMLEFPFLYRKTRESCLKKEYLLEIQ
jgi:hypothetical protein